MGAAQPACRAPGSRAATAPQQARRFEHATVQRRLGARQALRNTPAPPSPTWVLPTPFLAAALLFLATNLVGSTEAPSSCQRRGQERQHSMGLDGEGWDRLTSLRKALLGYILGGCDRAVALWQATHRRRRDSRTSPSGAASKCWDAPSSTLGGSRRQPRCNEGGPDLGGRRFGGRGGRCHLLLCGELWRVAIGGNLARQLVSAGLRQGHKRGTESSCRGWASAETSMAGHGLVAQQALSARCGPWTSSHSNQALRSCQARPSARHSRPANSQATPCPGSYRCAQVGIQAGGQAS